MKGGRKEKTSPPPRNSSANRTIFICIALAVLTFSVFSPAFRCGFINYDDQDYVYENAAVQHGVTASAVKWAFTTTHASNWHPLTWLSHMLDCQLFSLNPGGHHFTNVLLHACNSILLFIILRMLTGAPWRSAIVASLFALHPLHVESVAWVSERKDVLSTLFGLLSTLFYVRHVRGSSPKSGLNYILSLSLFALALLSKPMLVTLPFLFLLLDFWPLQRLFAGGAPTPAKTAPSLSRVLLDKVPFLFLSIASCVITVLVQRGKTVMTLEQLPVVARLANVVVSYATYFEKTFWPSGLCLFYPLLGPPAAWQTVASILLLLVITGIAIYFRKTRPVILFGWLWFLGMLVPVIGLVHVGEQSHADRYTYLPLIGIFTACVWTISEAAQRHTKLLAVISVVALAVFSTLSWRQVGFWKNSESVMTRAIAVTTDNFLAHNNLGVALAAQQRFDEAEAHYREAIRIKPGYARAFSNLGAALTLQDKYEEAVGYYEKSLQLRPWDAQAHHNLAVTLARLKRYDGTILHCQEALRNNPNYWMAYGDLALALFLTGKYAEAADAFEKSLQADPRDAQIQIRFAQVLYKLGRTDDARTHYQRAVQIDRTWDNPRFAEQLFATQQSNAK